MLFQKQNLKKMMIIIAKSVLLLFLLIISFAILFANNFIFEVIYLSVFSLLMSLLYLVMKAPDVAITEAAVGACITTLLLLRAIWTANEKDTKPDLRFKAKQFITIIIVCITGMTLLYALPELPQYGDIDSLANNDVYQFYLQNTESEFGFPNVITAILAGFRGYDTLGETVVIFTSSISVLLLLKNINRS